MLLRFLLTTILGSRTETTRLISSSETTKQYLRHFLLLDLDPLVRTTESYSLNAPWADRDHTRPLVNIQNFHTNTPRRETLFGWRGSGTAFSTGIEPTKQPKGVLKKLSYRTSGTMAICQFIPGFPPTPAAKKKNWG